MNTLTIIRDFPATYPPVREWPGPSIAQQLEDIRAKAAELARLAFQIKYPCQPSPERVNVVHAELSKSDGISVRRLAQKLHMSESSVQSSMMVLHNDKRADRVPKTHSKAESQWVAL